MRVAIEVDASADREELDRLAYLIWSARVLKARAEAGVYDSATRFRPDLGRVCDAFKFRKMARSARQRAAIEVKKGSLACR